MQAKEINSDSAIKLFDITTSSEKRKLDEDINGERKERKKVKQETKCRKAKRPGFSEERYNETSYYIENGLRKVYPYYFTFTTFCKGRWVGQPVLQVFSKEFRAHPPEEYERYLKNGTLTVNYKAVDADYKLQHNDLLANTVHRHEVPVANLPIEIIHLSEDLVVVNKPPSIPVHPCGRYRHNTVVFVLAKEFNLKNLRTVHRLDRLTSGLLLFGRTLKKARQLEHEIRNRLVTKEYITRVDGEFPKETVICEEPIEVVSYKIGVCRVGPNGKDCRTEFTCLSYNGKTSIVLCKPVTGRMHQIRVHLQYLDIENPGNCKAGDCKVGITCYPIVNDPLYNHPVFGPEKGKHGNIGKTNEELIAELIQIHNAETWLGSEDDSFPLASANPLAELSQMTTTYDEQKNEVDSEISHDVESKNPSIEHSSRIEKIACEATSDVKEINEISREESESDSRNQEESLVISKPLPLDSKKLVIDPNCYECKVKFRDPKPSDLVMYLHAWYYKGSDWEFKTELPEWSREDWEDVT